MLMGVSPHEVILAMGDGPTTATQLAAFLRSRGFVVPRRSRPMRAVPQTAIVRVAWSRGGSHWVVLHEGQVYDPEGIIEDVVLSRRHQIGWRVVSCLPVQKPAA